MKANKIKILAFTVFITIPLFIYSQSNVPTRDSGFFCTCTGNGTDPSPAPYTQYKHYIINGLGDEVLVANYCNYIEFSPVYKVVADGDTSYFEIEPKCPLPDPFVFLDDPNFDINEFNNNDSDTYGELSVKYRDNQKLILKYTHPITPPITGKFVSVFPSLGLYGAEIQIYNPPVVMIHGLWSERSAFENMESYLLGTGRFEPPQLYRADYETTNDREFSHNFDVPRIAINQVLGQSLQEFVAASKANVVGHSMGGLLTRQYNQSLQYGTQNSITKIITCNTPHQGSQMANWLLDNTSIPGTKAKGILSSFGMSSTKGAVNDLRVNSNAIISIKNGVPTKPVSVCAITTVQSHQVAVPPSISAINAFTYIAAQLAAACTNNYLTDIFDSPDSDIVVALESQEGGLTGEKKDVHTNQKHDGSVSNAQVMAAVESKLIQPLNSPLFGPSYLPAGLNYAIGNNCLFESKPNKEAKIAAANISISSPIADDQVLAGSSITINFTSTEVDSVVAFIPRADEDFNFKKVKATENTIILPTDIKLLGQVNLVLLGYSATNELVASANLLLNQKTNAILEGIRVYPKSVHLHVGDSLALTITGLFNDTIERDITKDRKLTYTSLNNTASNAGHVIRLNSAVNDTLIIDYAIAAGARISKPQITPIQLVVNTLDQTQTPLPVTLLSFTGKATENGNLLEWKTANETNFSHFEIERSSPVSPDGGISNQKFEKIGKKDSNESKIYEYLDNSQLITRHSSLFYRLKLIDIDGKSSYSKIIFIENEHEVKFSAYPNPFSDKISVDNIENKELKISLVDMTGREIIKQFISNQNRIDLNTEKIGTGIYFLQIKEANNTKTIKLLKE